ncbi:MAG: 16S rRNA processing protein RimM [Candidatus Eisenbacteria bacterium]|nr:16S rRNA processing protein RimM [Candidatus Eisenbacteria bacterium]
MPRSSRTAGGRSAARGSSSPPQRAAREDAAPHSGDTWVAIGRFGRTVGLRGEIVVHYFGDTPERFRVGAHLHVRTPAGREAWTVSRARAAGRRWVVAFEDHERIEDVQAHVGELLEVPAADLPALEEGRYYHYQLIGLRVRSADGRELGRVDEILVTPGNDVYCVRAGAREILVPAIEDAIAEIDLEGGTLTLRDLPGLVEP